MEPGYRVQRVGSGLVAVSRVQGLRARFGVGWVIVGKGSASVGLRLWAVGYGSALRAVGSAVPSARDNRVTYVHPGVSEWYANGPLGIEQGFMVARPLSGGSGPLTLSIVLSGDLRPSLRGGGRSVSFGRGGCQVLVYRDLVAADARGHGLRWWLELHRGRLDIRVDTRGEAFPVRIDPFVQAAKLSASDGATDDSLGASVGVSADGSTVVAGAPQPTVGSKGAVYVFVKPAGGWSSGTQAAKLTASDGTAGDQAGLGWSVGISSDGSTVVAGAPQGALRSSPPGAAYVFGSGTPTAAVAPLGHARVVGTTVSVPISCTGPRGASCQATLTLNIVETLKGGTVIAVTANKSKPAKTTKKLLTLGSTRVGIAAGKSKTVRLTLNSTGKRLLAARHRVRAKLTLAQTGASATSTIVTFTAKTKARPIAH